MVQQRPKNLMALYVHKDRLDYLELKEVLNNCARSTEVEFVVTF